MEFTATECGFDNGLGGASNAANKRDYHYVLFGRQTDKQHPEFSGVYFEFDDQINGAANCVSQVVIRDGAVDFGLKDGRKISVLRGMMAAQWDKFLSGVRDTFENEIVQLA
jgi:hypothetical protein